MTKNELISAIEQHLNEAADIKHQAGGAIMQFKRMNISLLLGVRGDGCWYVTDIERYPGAAQNIDLAGIPTVERATIASN